MKRITMICSSIFLLGIVLTVVFYVVLVFWMNEEIMLWGIRAGFLLMGISAVILIIILSLERVKDNKKLKNDIKEKDLRP
jgi:Na+-driven multidrug efflux pump